jgi:hypothetical protein
MHFGLTEDCVLLNHLRGEQELGASLPTALANRLHITKAEAGRRIADAEDLSERRALTGEPLAPQLSATATAQRQGSIGDGHVKVIVSSVTCPPRWTCRPARPPTSIWRRKPATSAPMSWPATPSE